MRQLGKFREYATRRFRLRLVTVNDVNEIYANFSDRELMKFYDMAPFESYEQAYDLVAYWRVSLLKGTGCRWGISEWDDNRLIGTIGLNNIDNTLERAEIGYELNRDWWGRGVMSETVPYVLRHAFHTLGLDKVIALIRPDNTASISLAEKLGFRRGGLLRNYIQVAGESKDVLSYSLLSSDYQLQQLVPAQAEKVRHVI